MIPSNGASVRVGPALMEQGTLNAWATTEAVPRLKRVLVVDDQEDSRHSLVRVLGSLGYEPELARDGIEALAKLKLDIDLVLLDARMPNLDGFEVAERIRQDPEFLHLPIIMLTGLNGSVDRIRSIEAGVNDFISKPFELTELRLRLAWLIKLKEAHDAIRRHEIELEITVAKRTADLREALDDMVVAQRTTFDAHLGTIRRLVLAAEYKDPATAAHIERIGQYSKLIAEGLSLSPGRIAMIRHASPMHDVGKIGIPDAILAKTGALNEGEWEIMREHATMGARILHGSPSKVLQAGEVFAYSHHEKWDGSGYPNGRVGEEIPLEGRICAVADVFDAMTSHRPYRRALPSEDVCDMMKSERGRHFDPQVLDVFFDHRKDIEAIRQKCLGSSVN